jgi:hypothetical protein
MNVDVLSVEALIELQQFQHQQMVLYLTQFQHQQMVLLLKIHQQCRRLVDVLRIDEQLPMNRLCLEDR